MQCPLKWLFRSGIGVVFNILFPAEPFEYESTTDPQGRLF